MSIVLTVLFWVFVVCLCYVLLLGYGELARLALSLLRLAAYAEKRQLPPQARHVQDGSLAPVTVILPGCEETGDAAAYVGHHLKLDYPAYEVVAVCDGGKNGTLAKLQNVFRLVKIDQPIKRSVPMGAVRGVYRSPLWENLIVVDKVPGGHHDELNCGVNVSRYPILATVSPGRWLHGDHLWPLARPFMLRYETLAVGGLPRFSGVFQGVFAQLQQTVLLKEYPAGIAVPGQKRLPLVPEGYGAFRKTAVIGVGGFAKKAAELDMAARLFAGQTAGAAGVQLLPGAVYQMVPRRGLIGLWQGCLAMQKEMQSTLWGCRGMLLRPQYGRTGCWDVPVHLLLDIVGPILEVLGIGLGIGLYAAGTLSGTLFWGFWVAQILFGMLTALAAVLSQQVEEKEKFTMQRLLKNVGCALLYPLGFRQLLAVLRTAAVFAKRK